MTIETFIMILPIILIHLSLAVYCIIKINKKEKFKYVNKIAWIIIVLFLQIVGSIVYLCVEND